MADKRTVKIFSAGCPICDDVIQQVEAMACPACEIEVLDLNDEAVARQAADLGIRSVPAVAVDGGLAACCSDRGVDESALRAAGIGQPMA